MRFNFDSIIVVTRIFAATAAFSFNNPMNYMFIPADLAIVNILSSRVFRNLKLNPQLEGDLSRIPTPISFASSPRRTCNNSGESSAQSTCNVISDSMTCLQTTQSADWLRDLAHWELETRAIWNRFSVSLFIYIMHISCNFIVIIILFSTHNPINSDNSSRWLWILALKGSVCRMRLLACLSVR